MRNFSRQREAIRLYLNGRTDHPTADQIYNAVKVASPEISRGTVYRNLGVLVDDGELGRINCGDGSEHYDPRTDMHGHFFCTRCGKLSDIETPGMAGMRERLSGEMGAKVGPASVVFNGICENCR